LNGSSYGPGVTLQNYLYNPPITTAQNGLQPWTFTYNQGGIALTTSPWDPPAPIAPPQGSQYAFLQTSPHNVPALAVSQMSTTVTGFIANSPYTMNFYWAARLGSGGSNTQTQLTVFINNNLVFTSQANLSDATGWNQSTTPSFSPSTTSISLLFTATSLSFTDHAILIDAISFSSTGGGGSNGLSGGAIAGIVIGSVVGGILCIVLLCCFIVGRRGKGGRGHTKHTDEHTEDSSASATPAEEQSSEHTGTREGVEMA